MAGIVVQVLCVTATGSPDSSVCLTLLLPAGHVDPVFSDIVSSAAMHRNNSELHNTEKKVLFATCAAPVPRYA